MIWILFTVPFMLLAVAIAAAPLVVTMLREHRATTADAPAVACTSASNAAAPITTTFGRSASDRSGRDAEENLLVA